MTLDIALPFYGDVNYLKQTVASVIAQSDSDWRLIVVDDGYPDDSIPGWFSDLNDSRIIYTRNEVNLGANGNFRRCINFVESEFCVIMGADDLLEKNFVSVVSTLINENPFVSIVHPGVTVVDEDNSVFETHVDRAKDRIRPIRKDTEVMEGESLAISLMRGNWMYFPSMVWKTSDIKAVGFRDGLNVCQDLALAIDLIKQGKSMIISDEKIFRYRRHAASDSSLKAFSGERFIEEDEFFRKLSSEFRNIGWKKASFSARIHVTSRLHALSLLPASIRARKGIWKLAKHAFF